MKTREYLDYYSKNKIIPAVDLNDLSKNMLKQQRFSFFFKIGIIPNDFVNKEVLELCPGPGSNSFYLLKYTKVKHITLVDNNPSSIKALKRNLKSFKNKTIFNEDIKKIRLKKKYDYVIIENALLGLNNPSKVFNKMYGFLKTGGCLVFTISDEVAYLSEKMRFLYSQIIIQKNNLNTKPYNTKVKILTKVFKSHLDKLQAKTRKAEKWVQDMMLHHHMIQKNKYFSLLDLAKVIKNKRLVFKGQSPDFYTDYQWYKKFEIQKYNQHVVRNYKNKRINFLDFKQKFNSKNNKKKEKIINKIIIVNKLINKMNIKKIEKFYVLRILNKLSKISLDLYNLEKNNKISLAIDDFVKSLKIYFKTGKININGINLFKSFWGHGTSQISMLKY